ncbi:MAG TPA: mercuric reductase [Candidatus Hydrogenedentes bacterium]|nr:mercuric reductase [Candidatus Hydrogenedentota bacterium]
MNESPANIAPMDAHNKALLGNVHPADWQNPTPRERYNLVVVGAGPAGLVAAAGAAGVGAKVALIERHLMGGDCLNVGCVPSKSLIKSARVAARSRRTEPFGVKTGGEVSVDFGEVMERVRRIRASISGADSADRYQNELGVDVFLGDARFSGQTTLEVGGAELRFSRAVVATGARAAAPDTPGLAEAGYLTNETVFNLTELPRRLAVVGGGPIGCELAQAFRRLGSEVFLFQRGGQILNREDPDAAEILHRVFLSEGIQLHEDCDVVGVEKSTSGRLVHFQCGGSGQQVEVDEILVGVGRAPNVEGLGLEEAGVEYDARTGVKVDDRLRTSNPRIFAAGDCCMKYKFTHAADAAARIVIQNALFWGRKKLSALTVPWCTYTDPEIAHVGMSEKEAAARGSEVDTYRRDIHETDRGAADGVADGFVKIITAKGSGKILGATIVAEDAGNILNVITLAMSQNIGLGGLANVIHPYPTQAEAVKQAADAYSRTRLTPFVKGLFEWILARRR